MKTLTPLLLALALLLAPAWGAARGRSSGSRRTYSTPKATARKPSAKVRSHTRCYNCPRDAAGRIRRSDSARRRFEKQNPCPATGRNSGPCPGYQVDHKIPLSKGGADAPANMQWLSDSQHKAKHAAR